MSENDDDLMVRVAWYYYVGGPQPGDDGLAAGLTRARVNKMLSEARETGLVSISIDHQRAGTMPLETELERRFGLDFLYHNARFRLSRA